MAFSIRQLTCLLLLAAISSHGIVDAAGRAEVVHNCSYGVWCAVVVGYKPDDRTPEDQRAPVNWMTQPRGQVIVDNFAANPADTGIALMCTRDPRASKPAVTQLEYTWRPDIRQTFFDVSNVEGNPFMVEGFTLVVDDPVKPLLDTCRGAYCASGDENCREIYNKWNDDVQGMRACSTEVVARLTLCSG